LKVKEMKNKVNHKPIKPVGEIDSIEELAALRHSLNVNKIHNDELSFGDRIADGMADVAGSWGFIISFVGVLIIWIIINTILLLTHPFDPYPFILLNLVLSCVAALQAPVIMMSQNRQEKKDRLRSEQDYQINLKAEILIEDIIGRLKRLEDNHKEFGKSQEEILKLLKSGK
jgi:uncharacterized membrane protein